MRQVYANQAKERQGKRNFFFSMLFLLVLLSVLFYEQTVLDASFNFFPLIAGMILFSLWSSFTSSIVKREAYKLILLGGVFLVLNRVEHAYQWLEISLFNLYCLMYILFFYCYAKKISIEDKLQQGYICFINYFLIFYAIVLDVSIVVDKFFHNIEVEEMFYFDLGIKVIILFITVLTLLFHTVHSWKGKEQIESGEDLQKKKHYVTF